MTDDVKVLTKLWHLKSMQFELTTKAKHRFIVEYLTSATIL